MTARATEEDLLFYQGRLNRDRTATISPGGRPTPIAAKRGPRIRSCPSEDEEQITLVAWVRVHTGKWPMLQWFIHVPNGGKRHIIEAVKFKRFGVKPAFPDNVLFYPHHGYGAWVCELKALDGKPTAAQRQMKKDLCALGYDADIYYGWQAARDGLLRYLAD
jgi:hypothetical protein